MNRPSGKRAGIHLQLAFAVAAFGVIAGLPPASAVGRPAQPPVAAGLSEKTTFNFANIPVRSALQFIAEEGHFNLVVSDAVTGTVSLHLVGVTWEQALDVVLRLKGLRQSVDGNTRTISRATRSNDG